MKGARVATENIQVKDGGGNRTSISINREVFRLLSLDLGGSGSAKEFIKAGLSRNGLVSSEAALLIALRRIVKVEILTKADSVSE